LNHCSTDQTQPGNFVQAKSNTKSRKNDAIRVFLMQSRLFIRRKPPKTPYISISWMDGFLEIHPKEKNHAARD
jgi:hypothetical protein